MKKFCRITVAVTTAFGVLLGVTACANAPEPPAAEPIVAITAASTPEPTAENDGTTEPAVAPFDQDALVEELAKNPNVVLSDGSAVQEGDVGLTGPVVAGVFLIRDFGPSFEPDVYAGVGTSNPPSDDKLVISLTTDDASIREQFLAAARLPAEKVDFLLVQTTESRANELMDQVSADMQFWEENGIEIAGVGGETGYEFVIGVFDLTDEDRELLQDRYGPVPIVNRDESDREVSLDFGADASGYDATVPLAE